MSLLCHLPGCHLLHVVRDGADALSIAAEGRRDHACCPACRTRSSAVYSRYQRRPADLPAGGKVVRLRLTIRRFHCHHPGCPRRTFAERFPHLLGRHAQRTRRLAEVHARTGLALGGQLAARLLTHLAMPASATTLLRRIRQLPLPSSGGPHVVGVDDWALRKGRTYGTIVIDLERHRPSTCCRIARPRPWPLGSGANRRSASWRATARPRSRAAPRWALLQPSRSPIDGITAAERIQYEGYLRREEADTAIRALSQAGVPIRQIVRRLGHSRKVVREVLRGKRSDVFRVRQSSLEAYLPWLDAQWEAGARNATVLWRRAKEQGYRGSLRVVGEWATRRRRAEKAEVERLQRVPSARTLARLLTTSRDHLSKVETLTVAAVEQGVPALAEARKVVAAFQAMVRTMAPDKLDAWAARASESLVTSFARGIVRDGAAVRAALALPWSNGQTEGQVTRLKLIKRQMYGRGRIDLLQARLIGVSPL